MKIEKEDVFKAEMIDTHMYFNDLKKAETTICENEERSAFRRRFLRSSIMLMDCSISAR